MFNVAQMSLLMLFHPIDALDIIKRERKTFKPWRCALLMFLLAIVNYTYTFYVNYVLGNKQVQQASLPLDLAVAFLPLLTWVVSAYAITAIVVGEASFTELLTASCYCLTPVILFKPVLGLISNIMTSSEADIYAILSFAMYAWMIILLFYSLKRLNDYTFAKTLLITLIAIIAMLIIWGVLLLIIALFGQVVFFVQQIAREFQLKF